MRTHLLAIPAAALALVAAGTSGAVADRLITGADVKDGSLQYKDLSDTAHAKLKGARGPAGAPGQAGAGAQSLYFSTDLGSKSLTLPGGRTLTATCNGSGTAHGGSRSASVTIDQSKFLFLHGRVDASDGGAVLLAHHDGATTTYTVGEHAVDSSSTGPVTFEVVTSYFDGGPGPNPTPTQEQPTSGTFEVLGHSGGTTFSMDAWLYVDDQSRCQISVQAVPSTDSGTAAAS